MTREGFTDGEWLRMLRETRQAMQKRAMELTRNGVRLVEIAYEIAEDVESRQRMVAVQYLSDVIADVDSDDNAQAPVRVIVLEREKIAQLSDLHREQLRATVVQKP